MVENESATTGTNVARGRGVFDDEEDGIEREKPAMQQKVLTKFLGLPRFRSGNTCSPTSYVHKLDSRIKQAWLMAVLLCP